MEKQLLNRKIYKAIKKYDRQEMEDFFRTIYEEGFKDGFQEGANTGQQADVKIELVQFLEGIEIKGVGEKTKDKILQAYKERGKSNEK